MRRERLFRILGYLDEDLIEEADTASSPAAVQRHWRWTYLAASAACLALICTAIFVDFSGGGSKFTASTTESPAAAESPETGNGVERFEYATVDEPTGPEGISFMSYAGPVFPLTLAEETDGLTVKRSTIWDFTMQTDSDDNPRQWGADVSDSYILMNSTNGEILTMICYPYASSLADLDTEVPTLTIDGMETDVTLLAGAYTGGFRDAGIDDGSTWNLAPPDSWSDYSALLSDSTYLNQTFSSYSLEIPVTVYSFTDFEAPSSHNAATQAFQCTIDPDQTTILSYGFNGLDWDEDTGWRQYSYFVPKGNRLDISPKMLIVLGEDLEDYTLQGYVDGACETELYGVSCTVTRRETTMDAVLEELCAACIANSNWYIGMNAEEVFQHITPALYQQKVAELLLTHGIFSGSSVKDRYADGRLDEILQETLTQSRILYLTAEIAIPAGESVQVTLDFHKEPSFDYGCSGTEHIGLQGYDYVTTLGSNLTFTAHTAALNGTETIEITGQNFGFDLANGITEVMLDPQQEHYYLEVRPRS